MSEEKGKKRNLLVELQKEALEIERIKERDIKDARTKLLQKKYNEVLKQLSGKDLVDAYRFGRSREIITPPDLAKLHEIEAGECVEKCRCIAKIGSGGFKAKVLGEYPCKSQYDDDRAQEVYTIYVDEEKTPEDQIGKLLGAKLLRDPNYSPDDSEWSPPKTIWHRYQLVQKEFDRYFELT